MNKPVALILAAGRGTRMQSELPKVLHEIGGKAMIEMVHDAASSAGFEPVVVVGYRGELVRFILPKETRFVEQGEQLGTGHAVMLAGGILSHSGTIMVMPGDAPLITPSTLRLMRIGHTGLCTVLTSHMKDEEAGSSEYGRVIRVENIITEIVEASEATPEQLLVTEFNTGFYMFDANWLFSVATQSLNPHPPRGEYYITDAIKLAAKSGGLNGISIPDQQEVVGINDKKTLNNVRELVEQ